MYFYVDISFLAIYTCSNILRVIGSNVKHPALYLKRIGSTGRSCAITAKPYSSQINPAA